VRERAQRLLNVASAADDDHEYLRSKKVAPWGARFLHNCLVVPLFDANGVLQNLQFISADGRKRYLKGACVQGCFYRIAGHPRKICISEGFATAATIRAATDSTAIVAFDAGNLRAVAEAVVRAADGAEIIIAADDDWKRKGGNVGIEKATEAAAAIGAKIALPAFGQNRRDKDTDFNDLAEFIGLDAVRRCIEEAVTPEPEQKEVDVNSEIARLAQLSAVEYDRVRSDVARRLKVRLGTLDKAVAELRCEASSVRSDLPHWNVEPSSSSVAGAQLLDELAAIFRRYVILPRYGAETLALWVMHAWALDASDISPFLVLKSPEKRCGKTTVLVLLQFLTPKSELASNITPAAIFRYIEQERPTLIIDEADTFVNANDEMRGILNSGHTRASAFVIRVVEIAREHVAKRFSTWAAKAIAGIGSLADTISDRSIILVMQRKTRDQKVNRLRRRGSPELGEIRRKALRWTQDNQAALAEADERTEVPAELHDRAADNWRPLLTIADHAGHNWPDIARKAALALSGSDVADASTGVQLLADIRGAFKPGEDCLATKALIERLVADPERPWADYRRGTPLSDRQLASLLKPFGIFSGTVHRVGAPDAKGYTRQQFEEAWQRYLPPLSPTPPPETSSRPNPTGSTTYADFRNVQTDDRGRMENDDFSHSRSDLDVRTDRNPVDSGIDDGLPDRDSAPRQEEVIWTL
jgi:putative DNA primase/helicase